MIRMAAAGPAALISVVISNCNRAGLLRNCLDALRRQTHGNFEVVVVCPCPDDTLAVLKPYMPTIKCAQSRERNLSKSRLKVDAGLRERRAGRLAA